MRGVGQQMLLQGRLHGPESLSRELFAAALRLAAQPRPGRRGRRGPRHGGAQEWAAEIRDVVARVVVIDELDAAARRATVGVEP